MSIGWETLLELNLQPFKNGLIERVHIGKQVHLIGMRQVPHCDRRLNWPQISSDKSGCTLAEEQMKQKMFFSHSSWENRCECMEELWVTWCFRVLFFLFLPSTIAYPAPPTHPSCVFWVALLVIVSSLSFLSAIFGSFVL